VKTRIGIVAATLILATIALEGCSSQSIPTHWVRSTSEGAVYLTWTQKGSAITGTVEDAVVPPKTHTSKALIYLKSAFTGTVSKGAIVLHIVTPKETDRGTVTTQKLVISDTSNTTLEPGTRQDYTDAVAKLKKAAAS
jgi:hypothetical protein